MRLIEHLFRFLAPDECINCESEGALLCKPCAISTLQLLPERCYRCYRVSDGNKTCQACRHHSVLKAVWVRTEYGSTPRKLVHALKFNFARDAAKTVAYEMFTSLPAFSQDTLIVHVPAATTHVRQRGFDQSALIAREFSHLTRLPHVHALARRGQQRQVGADSQTRRAQMKGAFRTVSPHVIQDAHVLLVDDVLTTGSTLESAALELRCAGAKSVSAICFAQAK